MNDTCGQPSIASLRSALLTSSLANRLQAKTPLDGSMLYVLTWRARITPLGRLIPALRASGRSTSGNDSTGWPTARSTDANKSVKTLEGAQNEALRKGWNNDLPVAALGTWPTPTKSNVTGPGASGRDGGLNLQTAVHQLAAWPTPMAEDAHRGLKDSSRDTVLEGDRRSNLNQTAVLMAPWSTPRAVGAGHSTGNETRALDHKSRLEDQVFLAAGWATPAAQEAGGTPEQFLERKRRAVSNGHSLGISLTSLSLQAQPLAPWCTPQARDHRSGETSDQTQDKNCRPLNEQVVALFPWQTPACNDARSRPYTYDQQDKTKPRLSNEGLACGAPAIGIPAPTAENAQLNPAFSLWLQGYPIAWYESAPPVFARVYWTMTPGIRSKLKNTIRIPA